MRFAICVALLAQAGLASAGIDETVNNAVKPLAAGLSSFIFFKVNLFGAQMPLIVLWLISAAVFFTGYFRFINLWGFAQAFRLLRGDYSHNDHKGEVSHFQALATALSGTVGIGNIGGVAVVISLGGPGATFWLVVAGLLGMATKMAECIAGVKFRRLNPDGSVSGGPMYYLEEGFRGSRFPWLAKPMGTFYALAIVIGCLGIGNMFQSNQAFRQFVFVTGDQASFFADKGWLFGLAIAAVVGVVIIGGLRSIARVTSKLVPFMALLYALGCIIIIAMNFGRIPAVVADIFTQAFDPQAMAGGVAAVMILGFQRAVFSNEAGIGSASIAHSAVKTAEPATEGYVGLIEPFIDTVIICTMTALVILLTVYDPAMAGQGVQGVELTSSAFAGEIPGSQYVLSFVAILFAFSTMISWSYYGLKGWTYLFGETRIADVTFKFIFCSFVALGCAVQLDAVLDFSDAMVFLIALPNVVGLYLLAPVIKRELISFQLRIASEEITNYRYIAQREEP